jgi:Domain of unknown function (DUF4177)
MTTQKWQYKTVKVEGHWDPGYVEQVLDAHGEQGWEAVSMGWMIAGPAGGGDATVLLKRALTVDH